jgi:hypothetical protein
MHEESEDTSHEGGDAGAGAATNSKPVDLSPIDPVSLHMVSSEGKSSPVSDELMAEIERKLRRSRSVNGFTTTGWNTLIGAQQLYIEHLASEAIYEAQRRGYDEVGPKHVELATYSSDRTTLIKALEPLGGVLAGAGASQALVMIVSSSSRTTFSIVLTLSLIVVGVAILSIALARSWRP